MPEAETPTGLPNATELPQLCESGTLLAEDEEPDVAGDPERVAKEGLLLVDIFLDLLPFSILGKTLTNHSSS